MPLILPILVVLAAAGAGLIVTGLARCLGDLAPHFRPRLRPVPRFSLPLKGIDKKTPDWRPLRWALAGGAAGTVAVWDLPSAPVAFGLAAMLGASAFYARRIIHERRLRWARLRAVSVLYDAVDLYAHAGYPLPDALLAAAAILPAIAPELRTCLRKWPQGPHRALADLGTDLALDEATMLASVLQHVVDMGPARLAGALASQAGTLSRLEEYAVEQQLSLRPLYQTLYLAIPGFALIGALTVPLGFHAIRLISQLQVN